MDQDERCGLKGLFRGTSCKFAAYVLIWLVTMQIWPVGEPNRQDHPSTGTAARIWASLAGSPAEAGTVSVFGPRKYLRTSGKPVVALDRFSAVAGKATLNVVNGEADGGNRVSSAVITLNGKSVFKTMDFNQNVYRLTASVDLDRQNSLAVQLESKPGSYLTVEIVTEGQNTPPVAHAGPDQTKRVGQTAQLDGSGSTDADGDPLHYFWSFTKRPAGSSAELSDPTAAKPTFVVDKPDSYEVQLVVNDGKADSAPDYVLINTENSPPVANAGPDQTAKVGDTVGLNGSGSTDIDGDQLIYDWTQFSVPDGSSASLSGASTVWPSFLVDKPGTYEATLVVNDGKVDSAPDTVVVTTVNSPPLANAGPDQKAHPGDVVVLDGSASSDADQDSLTYRWSLTRRPVGSNAELTGADTVTPTFEVDMLGDYIVQLIVNDGRADSQNADTVTISSENLKPVANAGLDQEVMVNHWVIIDGRGSYDPDDDGLSYKWSFISNPSGIASFDDPYAQTAAFLADVCGKYIVQLIVNDGFTDSDPDTVTITCPDQCPDDPNKTEPGVCGCGAADTDSDGDGTLDCLDECPSDPNKTAPGYCGCGVNDTDTDADGTPDCIDLCPFDPGKTAPGICGCGAPDTDTDGDGVSDCLDGCPLDAGKIEPGACGCGRVDTDTDGDGTPDCIDLCPNDATKTEPGICGCGAAETDTDGDGVPDCRDGCPFDAGKIEPGACGCGRVDTDTDRDGTPDCNDLCPNDATKTAPGSCGCGIPDTDSDGDGTMDCLQVPPNPATVAPPLNLTVPTDLYSATSFLYTGTNPIQTGVAEGTIQPYRAAVVRGKVLNQNGNALPGATVSLLNHPELGQTLTRMDGMFDLAVNGGGPLTVKYGKPGYLEAQRQVTVPWQDYVVLPDVTLLQLDPNVTSVNLNDSGIKVAKGSLSSDADGARQAILLFPEGTAAEMVLPGGSKQAFSSLSVRATEFTVGPNGPMAMPAALPPNVAYTYAVEFTVDEALAAGAKEVRFNKPVMHYLENFLGFPVGTTVPTGYYDRLQGTWVASDSGKVIRILSVTGGLADLDTNGDGAADDPATLAALGVSDAERAKLIEPGLYSTGQALWRVPIPHFSPWDENWALRLPADAKPPQQAPPKEKPREDPCRASGSIVECQNQVLGESIPVTGTPFSLNYSSERVPGHQVVFEIHMSGDSIPASLKRIELEISIAGNFFTATYDPPETNLTYSFTWDGRDVYGRYVQGGQRLIARIGYVYDAVYARTARFSANGGDTLETRTRGETIQWQEMLLPSFHLDASAQGLGGWTLNVHHTYDSGSGTLYLGGGSRQNGEALNDINVIETVAGGGKYVFGSGSGAALEAELAPWGIAMGADGSIYVTDAAGVVWRVTPDGTVRIIAGQYEQYGFAGDGGPATEALLSMFSNDLAIGPDGSLYIQQSESDNCRIRKIDPDGIISTVAGNGYYCSDSLQPCGDGGPALVASLGRDGGIGVGPDGSIYIAEPGRARVRRIGPDGIINTIAGTGIFMHTGDGGPAINARIQRPADVAVGRDGSLYISDYASSVIRKVGTDGIIHTIAGIPLNKGFDGDGLLATQSKLYMPKKLCIDSNDVLYANDYVIIGGKYYPKIRRVWPAGIMDTAAGSGLEGFSGDLGPAIRAQLNNWDGGIAVGPDGALYIADSRNGRVRKVSSAMPKRGISDVVLIPSRDGREIYQLDRFYRHVKTLHGLTGAVLYQLDYDANGFLLKVTDGDGKITAIERQADGTPTGLVGPYGHVTTLQLDANGYISAITNPAAETVQFAYSDTGLMRQMIDGRGNVFSFTYDALGRLSHDQNPAGGFLTLERTDQTEGEGYTVTTNTALNRSTAYQTEYLATGQKRSTNTSPTGAQAVSLAELDGNETTVLPDGMSLKTVPEGDPRFGLTAPIEKRQSVKTPSGLTLNLSTTRTVTLANPYDPLSITSQLDLFTVNGNTYTTSTDVLARKVTQQTPVGRSSVSTFDAQERLLSYQPSGVEPFTLSYDAMGRLIDYGQATTRWSLVYDTMGRVSTVANTALETTTFGYDSADRLTAVQTPLGNSYTFDYDANGNPIEVTMPNGKIHGLSYNAINLLSEYTPPDTSLSYAWSYNADKELTQKQLPGGRTLDVTYDAAGRMTGIEYPEATVQFAYADLTERLSRITRTPEEGSSQQIQYGYDGSLLTALTFSGIASGAYSYAYSNDHLLTGIGFASGSDSVSIPLARDRDGLVTGYGNFGIARDAGTGRIASIGDDGSGAHPLQIHYAYDALGRPAGRTHSVNGTDIFSLQITRDSTGRVTRRTDNAASDTTYAYDRDGQLTEVSINGSPVERYTYDRNANRTGTGAAAAHYDGQDRITDQGGITYQHDEDGFMTQRGADTLVYSAQGELLQATVGGTTVSYAYDGFGRRVGRQVGSGEWQQYFYGSLSNPYLVTASRDPAGVLTTYHYDGFAHLFALQRGADWYYVATDQVGTPRVVSDAGGTIVKAMDYDSYGVLLSDSNREQPGFFTVDAGGIVRRCLGNKLSGCEKMRDIAKKL